MTTISGRLALLFAALAAASGCLAATGAGQGGATFPDCPPGTPALPPPTVTVQGSPASPGRIVAGRAFEISYDSSDVAVQDTLAGSPGTSFDFDNTGPSVTVTVATAGPAAFTVRYYKADASRTTACIQGHPFTVNLEAGDPLPARLGYIEGPEARWPRGRPPRLPKKGSLLSGPPLVGTFWDCSATTAKVPVTAELYVERALRRKPTETSPSARLTLEDPCATKASSAAAAGALLRFTGGPATDDGERTVAVQHRFTQGARFWLRITQAGRLIGQLRYYVAFRPQAGRFAAVWVIAPEAALEAARCRRPPRGDPRVPLGFRKFPIPPCAR